MFLFILPLSLLDGDDDDDHHFFDDDDEYDDDFDGAFQTCCTLDCFSFSFAEDIVAPSTQAKVSLSENYDDDEEEEDEEEDRRTEMIKMMMMRRRRRRMKELFLRRQHDICFLSK